MGKVRLPIFAVALFLSFSLLHFNISDTKAATRICLQPTVTVDPQNKFSTIVKIKGEAKPRVPLKYHIRLRDIIKEGNQETDPKDKYPIWIFNFNKLVPGGYQFKLLEGKEKTYCEGRLTVPDNGQGGEVHSSISAGGRIQFSPSNPKGTDPISVTISNLQEDGRFMMRIIRLEFSEYIEEDQKFECENSEKKTTITFRLNPLNEGHWIINIYKLHNNDPDFCELPQTGNSEDFKEIGSGSITISRTLPHTNPTPTLSSLPPCAKWVYSFPTNNPDSRLNSLPIPTPAPNEKGPIYNDPDFKDRKCAEVATGIVNISTEPLGFVKSILSLVLGLSGGIAVLLIIVSGYKFMASQGNPEAIQGAKDQLTSAIIGLLFIIFSLVILEVIGVDILKIPGFQP